MKKAKRMLAIFMTLAMVLTMTIAMGATVFADETSQHTITITNTDQNVSHTYEGYQIFKGKLDVNQQKLSDIVWGDGVDGDALLAALQASTDAELTGQFDECETAADVAKVFATFQDTSSAAASSGAIDAVAKVIAESGALKSANKISFTEAEKEYTATVTGDGYYFIKDVTTELNDEETGASDTLSKYLLAVVKDTTIVAKDTGLTPDKKILQNAETKVADDSAAMGDVVDFEVTVPVPNTKKYVDHFIFFMEDTLPPGLTFFGIDSIKIGDVDLTSSNYTLTVKTGDEDFTVPSTSDEAVTTEGGQAVKIVFNNFKAFVEADQDTETEGVQDLLGETVVIKYKAVVNEDASFEPSGNENEVTFTYSNDPNHDYGGDEPDTNDPVGETPESKTRTYLTKLKVIKKDDKGNALAGATFELKGDALKYVLQSGEKYEKVGYVAKDGETIESGQYWELTNGTYTTTSPDTEGVDTTKYAKDDTGAYIECVKVTYSKIVTEAVSTTLTATSDKNGLILFEGLNAGTYTLKETSAPDGYNLDPNTYTVQIDWTDPTAATVSDEIKEMGGFSINASGSSDAASGGEMFTIAIDGGDVTVSTTIINQSGAELPGTGGIGTIIFYVLGSLLVVGCGIVLISKRRVTDK